MGKQINRQFVSLNDIYSLLDLDFCTSEEGSVLGFQCDEKIKSEIDKQSSKSSILLDFDICDLEKDLV